MYVPVLKNGVTCMLVFMSSGVYVLVLKSGVVCVFVFQSGVLCVLVFMYSMCLYS